MQVRRVTRAEVRRLNLTYRYRTRSHWALSLTPRGHGWAIRFTLQPLPQELEKTFESTLFSPHVENPMVFVASVGEQDVAWMEVGHETWNNRVRIHELLVLEGFRRRGIGKRLLAKARRVAEEKRARMIVLETQSCNVVAIAFYRSQGYELIGFDTGAYSNSDVERGEVRLELGLKLKGSAAKDG